MNRRQSCSGASRFSANLFLKIIGGIFALVGLYFIVQSVGQYTESCQQRDWPLETATVTDVAERYKRIGISGGGKTVYDVSFTYTVDKTVYTGMIDGTVDGTKRRGTTFKIKYNPKNPAENTDVLFPSVSGLLTGILSSLFFIAFSLIVTWRCPETWFARFQKRKS